MTRSRTARRWRLLTPLAAIAAWTLAAAAPAQPAPTTGPEPAPIHSMGQPPLWKPYVAGSFTWNREADRTGGVGVLGIHKDLMNPMIGAFGLSGEGYLGGAGGDWDGGARLFLTSRLLFLNVGVDYNARDEEADFILAFTPYFRRGGLFGTGGNFRIEWIPGRNHSFNFGFQIPLEPHMGRTRPVARKAPLPRPPAPAPGPALTPEAAEALANLRYEALWLLSHADVFNDDDAETYGEAMARFRSDLEAAHAAFTRDRRAPPRGTQLRGRETPLRGGLRPRLCRGGGRARGPGGVGPRARGPAGRGPDPLQPADRPPQGPRRPARPGGDGPPAPGHGPRPDGGLDEHRRRAALAVFDEIADVVEAGRRIEERHWEGDERKVWLPLQLALRSEHVDSQAELDAVIERALGRPFTGGNAIFPTNSTRFLLELLRSIEAAEDYHVLWIHDYAGLTGGKPDPVTHRVTVEGYLRTLTRRIRDFDRTGRLPYFLIFQTQWFYEMNGNRVFLSLLEDPLRHEIDLGDGFEAMEEAVREAQEELRRAVAGSAALAEARARARGRCGAGPRARPRERHPARGPVVPLPGAGGSSSPSSPTPSCSTTASSSSTT